MQFEIQILILMCTKNSSKLCINANGITQGQLTLFVPRPCRSVSHHNLGLLKISDFDKSAFHFSPTVTLIRFARPEKRFDTSIAAGLQGRL